MEEQYQRMTRILGKPALETLKTCRVAVFGLGGVGGSALEALARSGVGTLDVIDPDVIVPSNLNRQALARRSTLGLAKTEAARRLAADIDPDIVVNAYPVFYLPGTPQADQFDFGQWDFVLDCVDTVRAKLGIALAAQAAGVPEVAVMGCGNRVDPSRLKVCDLYETANDPLAKVMRHEGRRLGLDHLTVVCSDEPALTPLEAEGASDRSVPGSTAFVPPAAGLLAASVCVCTLTGLSRR